MEEIQVPIVTPHVTNSQTQRGTTVMPDSPRYSPPLSRLRSSGNFGNSKKTLLNLTNSEHREKIAMNPQEKTDFIENSPNEGTAALRLDLPSMATFKLEPLLSFKPDPPIKVDEDNVKIEYFRKLTPVFTPPLFDRRSPKAANDFISSPFLNFHDDAIVAKNK
jgi:hypothetical protein